MAQRIRLTESELRDIIEMTINEALIEEDLVRNLVRGVKSAFGGDAGRIGQGARRIGGALKRGAKKLAKGAVDKYYDAKVGYQTGKQNDQLNKIKNTLQGMVDSGQLGKGNVAQAAQNFIGTIDTAIRNNDSAADNPRGIQGKRFRPTTPTQR